VPYTIVGGIKFYSRKEIKDVLGYLRLLVNPNDDESLRRVINVPARGIGGTTLQRFEDYAAERREPILKVLRDVETDETFSARPRKAAADFVNLIDDLAVEAIDRPHQRRGAIVLGRVHVGARCNGRQRVLAFTIADQLGQASRGQHGQQRGRERQQDSRIAHG
jgi:superfamily I DNA/RNA helicase